MKFNKLIKLFSILSIFTFVLVSCEEDVTSGNPLASDYVSLAELPATVTMTDGESRTLEGKVFASKPSNVDRVLELEIITSSTHNVATNNPTAVPVTTINSSSFTVPATVTIPAGETEATFPISISSDDLNYQGKRLVIGIKSQEGLNIATSYMGAYGNANYEVFSKRLVVTAKKVCLINPFRIEINTDAYGSETTWELYDGDFAVIAEGGPYPDQSAVGIYPTTPTDLCLTSGNYTFVIYDEYSDGMNAGYGAGFYRLLNMNSDFSVEVSEIAKNGTFGANDVVEFTLP
jgi:hypothetical protein